MILMKIMLLNRVITKIKDQAGSNDHGHNDNYATKQEFNKLTTENFAAVLKQANQQLKLILLILQKWQTLMINVKI